LALHREPTTEKFLPHRQSASNSGKLELTDLNNFQIEGAFSGSLPGQRIPGGQTQREADSKRKRELVQN
jgi:hypothetical protein